MKAQRNSLKAVTHREPAVARGLAAGIGPYAGVLTPAGLRPYINGPR